MGTKIRQQEDGTLLVTIEVPLSGDNAVNLTTTIIRIAGKSKKTLLDIEKLEHINAAGIFALLKIRKAIIEKGGTVLLTKPRGIVKPILKIFKFETLFQFVPSITVTRIRTEVAA
jgi:anti-anti-sigma factor